MEDFYDGMACLGRSAGTPMAAAQRAADGAWLVCAKCRLPKYNVWRDNRTGAIEVRCDHCGEVALREEPAAPVPPPPANVLQPKPVPAGPIGQEDSSFD